MTDLLPSPAEWQQMMQMAGTLVKSGILPPTVKSPEAAVAIMLKGREINIPPMQSFAKISIINGKPAMDAELMLSLIYRNFPNADIQIIESTNQGASIDARRLPTQKYARFQFNLEDAKRANLLKKNTWNDYPKAMCLWRAVSAMARAVFPDCLMGISHTPEELGAEVDEEGQVIDIQAQPVLHDDSAKTQKAALAVEWIKAGQAFKAIGKTKEDVLAYLKKSSADDLVMEDFDTLNAWYSELTRDK